MELPFRGRIAASLKPKERLMSISFTEIVTQLALDTSYRGAAELANKIYHRTDSDSFIAETIKARCIRIGTAILSDYMAEATKVLEKHHIDQGTGIIVTIPFSTYFAFAEDFVPLHPQNTLNYV